jgi:hypothetical protein
MFFRLLTPVVLVSVRQWLCRVKSPCERIGKWETCPILKEDRALVRLNWWIYAPLLGVSRATVSKVMLAFTNHRKATSAKRNSGENQHWQKEIVIHREGLFRKITELLQHSWQDSRTEYSSWRPVSIKTVRRELDKSNIHGSGRAAIAKPPITQGNGQMRIRWCHDHEI